MRFRYILYRIHNNGVQNEIHSNRHRNDRLDARKHEMLSLGAMVMIDGVITETIEVKDPTS